MFHAPSLWRAGRRSLAQRNRDDYDPFFQFQRDMNRLFDNAFSGFGAPSVWSGDDAAERSIRVDVHETKDALEVEAELPGVAEDDIDVELVDDLLTIRGEKKYEKKEEKDGEIRTMERAYGSFSRSMTLPYDVDPDAVEAVFKNGVLKLTLPKPAQTRDRSRRISIKRG